MPSPAYISAATYKMTPAADRILATMAKDGMEDRRESSVETESERAARIAFMNQRRHPAEFYAREAGWLLGKTEQEISILSCAGHLPVLGTHLAKNAPKKFARDLIYQLGTDIEWLSKAKDIISDHWRIRNQRSTRSPKSLAQKIKEG